MKKTYQLALFVLAIATAYAAAQSSQTTPAGNNAGSVYGNSSPNGQTQLGSSAPAQPAGTARPSTPTTPSTPQGSSPGSGTDASGGGAAGAAGTTPVETPQTPGAESGGTALMTDSDLQREIQNALSKEPTLSGDNVSVTVSGENIETTGSVNTAKEKLTATRIVQSFAGNRKVVNHVTVGRNSTSPANSPDRESTDDHRPANSNANPASMNPEPNKGQPPAGSGRPPR